MSSSSEEAEFDNDASVGNEDQEEGESDSESESDDEPLSTMKTPPRRSSSAKKISYADDDSDDDDDGESDDDIPLSALAPKKSPAKRKSPQKKKTQAPAKKKKKAAQSTSSSDSKKYDSASAALYGTECTKGIMIQRLLCRWWYSVTWPDPSVIPTEPPPLHDSLDGFPGVYVCTSGDNVGTIKDFRNKEDCPSFANFSKKDSKELKELLLEALNEQKKALIAHDGQGTPTEKELEKLIKWTNKVNAIKADKEAKTVLKASKF